MRPDLQRTSTNLTIRIWGSLINREWRLRLRATTYHFEPLLSIRKRYKKRQKTSVCNLNSVSAPGWKRSATDLKVAYLHQLLSIWWFTLPGSCAQKQWNGPGMFMSPRTQHCRLSFRMSTFVQSKPPPFHLLHKTLVAKISGPYDRPLFNGAKQKLHLQLSMWKKCVSHISCQKFFSGHMLKPLFTCATLAQHGLEVWNSRNLSQPWRWMTPGVHFAHLFLTSCVDLSETVRCFWVCAHRLVEHAL